MSYSTDSAVTDVAEVLQQQIIYNGEMLDIAFESLRTYKEGTQSLTYLDSSVHLAYALLRLLERWGKKRGKGEMYVRRRANSRRKRKGRTSSVFWNEDWLDITPKAEMKKVCQMLKRKKTIIQMRRSCTRQCSLSRCSKW